ncbi:hypothetical protein [Dickeya zeae]|uniref:hypothetical protein n=1 Tax=Dickeya zeae TaxID=204042 RepID=UPI0003AAA7F6|nr:hypothetical protein [Dickeya zeae]
MMKKTLAILVLALAIPAGALAAEQPAVNGGQPVGGVTFQGSGIAAGSHAFSAAHGRGTGYGYGFGRAVAAGVVSASTSTTSSTVGTSTSTVTSTRG